MSAAGLPLFGDRWWVATLLLFSVRWPWVAPLMALLPLALAFRRRSLPVLAVAAVVAFGGVLDVRIPWRTWLHRPAPDAPALRIVTWNIHRCIGLNTAAARAWLADQRADVIALEEWPRGLDVEPLVGDGWQVLFDGELCVLSRRPIRRWSPPPFGIAFATHGAGSRYVLSTPAGDVPLAALHLSSPHPDFTAAVQGEPNAHERVARNSTRRAAQAAEVGDWVRDAGPRSIVVGDLNTPSDSAIFRGLQRAGLSDAFLTAGSGFGWTYQHRAALTRIDHVMFGPAWSCDHCAVGPMVGSPHRPVVADLRLTTPSNP